MWFRRAFDGRGARGLFCTEEHPDGDFDNVADADPAADFATFRDEVRLSRGHEAARRPRPTIRQPEGREHSNLRWVYLHMIEEYARHNGHADLIRERIDGTTGE